VAFLREHGVEVIEGVREAEAAALNAAFFTAVTKGRPHVTVKIATSLDGRVAARTGARTPLTGPEANRRVHLLRAEVDAIAIGSETLVVDDPLLTVREVYRARPFVRVVLDRRLRTPATARIFTTLDQGPVWVCTAEPSRDASPARVEALVAAGAEVVATPRGDLAEVFRELGRREVRSLLLEGGPTLHAAAWRAELADRVLVLVAPRILGPAGIPWSMPAGMDLAGLLRRVEPVGPDVLLEGDVHWTH
jgi:diaminohydroxyphosphoribosylaminopyrimidine deaminase/5-amino-6-(5-phosphoribosylamino)uracil reductase